MKRRTEITVETDRILLVRRRREERTAAAIWCATCATDSFMFTVDEAAALLGTSSMTVFRWAERGRLHWLETAEGKVLICQNSLLQNRRLLLEEHHENHND